MLIFLETVGAFLVFSFPGISQVLKGSVFHFISIPNVAVMDFQAIMEKVNRDLVLSFTNQVHNHPNLSVNQYKFGFLATFLGNPPVSPNNPAEWHTWVDSVSLCGPEITFLHQFVNLNAEGSHFIKDAIALYRQVDELPQCQLGKPFFECLQETQEIVLQ